MTNQESRGIKFKRALLAAFAMITAPGLYKVVVQSNVTEANLVADEDGNNPRYITTLKAIAKDKLPQVREVFATAEEVDIEQTNGLFLTANIWKREGRPADLPMKGETVEVTVDEVTSREGELVLRVTNLKRIPATSAPKINLDKFFSEEEEVLAQEDGEIIHQ